MTTLNQQSANELLDKIQAGSATADVIFKSCRDQIEAIDSSVHAFVRLNDAQALKHHFNDGAYPIPIAIKDNICIQGKPTTCSSHILKGFVPPYNATVIEKINTAGIPIIGQCNMDEFAFGSSTENSYYGPTHNPWDTSCVPGGSSGGSTAAVAASEATWALGSDTGGSIRQPASFCGVVGVKPTYGRVSRYGLIAFASSLDQIGPITKDVRDAALLLKIIAGYDERDSTSANLPVPDFTQALKNDVRGLTLGVPEEFFIEGLDPQVETAVKTAIDVLKDCGAHITNISLPHTEYAVATYYIIATAEASSNLARFDGVQYGIREIPPNSRDSSIVDMYEETRDKGFGPEAKRRIMLGTYSLSSGYYDAYYLRALKVRTLIKQDFDEVFKKCDAVITPTSPTTAFKIGEKSNDPLSMYLSDIYTISTNLSGLPAISVPCGFSDAGLPIGLQLITKAFDEEMMFRIAYSYQQNTDWHTKRPTLE